MGESVVNATFHDFEYALDVKHDVLPFVQRPTVLKYCTTKQKLGGHGKKVHGTLQPFPSNKVAGGSREHSKPRLTRYWGKGRMVTVGGVPMRQSACVLGVPSHVMPYNRGAKKKTRIRARSKRNQTRSSTWMARPLCLICGPS